MSDSIYGPADKSPSRKRPRTNNNDSITRNSAKTTTTTTTTRPSLNNNTIVRYNKRLFSETQRVPWIDFFELQAVGRSLLSILNDNNNNSNNLQSAASASAEINICMSMQDALERVEVWKARCCGGNDLPHAIESTAALAQILWKESISTTTSTSSTSSYSSSSNYTFPTMDLRLSYASAVIRTINGLTDSFQQERAVATSVAHICERYLNIPSWLVDVRHEATHNQLPTLSVLRMAAKYLLQYWQDAYWQPLFLQQQAKEQNVVLEYLQIYEEIIVTTKSSNSPSDSSTMKSENAGRATATTTTTARTKNNAASKTIVKNNSNGKIKGNGESDDEQEDQNDKDDDDDPLLLRSSRLGTNINMFAVLMESSKKDKKKRKMEEQAKAEAERLQKEEAERLEELERAKQQEQLSWKSSPTACAEQLVKVSTSSSSMMMIPIDVLWTVLLSHLIWRPRTTTATANMSCTCCAYNDMQHHHYHHASSGCCCGVLVPTCLQAFPPTMKSVGMLRNRYRPLLTALGQQWPGLISALLVHIVDGMIRLETTLSLSSSSSSSSCSFSLQVVSNNHQSSSSTDDMNGPTTTTTTPVTFQTIARKQQGLYFLDSWARFLLSSSFLVDSLGLLQKHEQKQQQQQQQPRTSSVNSSSSSSSSKKIDDEPACREILQSVMHYPLNSLCDRLLLSLSKQDDTSRATTTTTNATSSSTCRKLGLYLQDILGPDRHANFGVVITEKEEHDGCLYRSLYSVDSANVDKQTNAKNDTNESAPVVYGPCLPNDESRCIEEGDSTKDDEHDDESSTMDQEETMACDDAARPGEYVAAMDIVHGPKPMNDVAVYEEEKRKGISHPPSMETETQMGQTADSQVNNKAKHGDKEVEQGEPILTGCCYEMNDAGSSLSLAQMEALLFNQNDHSRNDDIVQETAAHDEPDMLQNVGETVPQTSTASAVPVTQQQQQRRQQRSPWVKCLAWDACAIGSLPGYPM